jgi:hypothetical protein
MHWIFIVVLFVLVVGESKRSDEIERENVNLQVRVNALEQKLGVKM